MRMYCSAARATTPSTARTIQRELQNPLAGLILEGGIAEGDQVIVSASDDGLVINGKPAAAEAAA